MQTMRKFILLLACVSLIVQTFGQLNPINNLVWENDYIYPPGLNTYLLSWVIPDESADTLVGYNIYGGDSLWRFQTFIGAYCNESVCPDSLFIYEFLTQGDYIKVTAVYNNSFEESVVNDSAQFFGLLVGIKGFPEKNKPKLYPNPTTGKLTVKADVPFRLELMNVSGTIILEQSSTPTIDLSTYSKGIYFIKIIVTQGISIEKIILK